MDQVLWPRKKRAAEPAVIPAFPETARSKPRAPNTGVREPLLPTTLTERLAIVERDAFTRGIAEGERLAAAAAAARVEEALQRVAATIVEIGALRVDVLRRTERDVVRLAVAMSEHILRQQVAINPSSLLTMASVALERLGKSVVGTLHLSPADHEVLQRTSSAALANLGVEIVGDSQLPPGSCLIRSTSGDIDASISSQIRELARALLGEDTPAESSHLRQGSGGQADDGSTQA